MKIVFYLLTIIFGCLGILAVFRTIELLINGNAIKPIQILLAITGFTLAVFFLNKSRGK
jgi:hypothetical protein